MKDLDEAALAMPGAAVTLDGEGRPEYRVEGKAFCFHRSRRKDAVDPVSGEVLNDVLVFYVESLDIKELLLADSRGIFFSTPHFDGYACILLRQRNLKKISKDELYELTADAWLCRVSKRTGLQWLHDKGDAS